MLTRTPLSIVDESIFHLDQEAEPWSVHCEVRVPGRLDAERVAVAAVAAAARHPIARVRLASFRYRDRRLFWEIPDAVDHLALEIVDCDDEAAVASARERLEGMRVSLHSSPPFALTLAHRPGGDSLMMNLHHAAGDGMSSYRLLTSIARAYAGVDDPVPDVDPLAARDLLARFGIGSVKDAMSRARELSDLVSELRSGGPAARVAIAGGRADARNYGFHLLRLGPEETERLSEQRRKPATINDLLLATLAIAIDRFNAQRGVRTGRISAMMPVSLRPTEWSEEVVGNILSFVPVSVLADERTDPVTAQLAIQARTHTLKDHRISATMLEALGLLAACPFGVKHFLARALRGPVSGRLLDTAILSNLGALTLPLDFGVGAGTASEIWFSPPGQMPLGTSVGAASMNGKTFFTLRYSKAQYDAAGAAALAHTWREVLVPGS